VISCVSVQYFRLECCASVGTVGSLFSYLSYLFGVFLLFDGQGGGGGLGAGCCQLQSHSIIIAHSVGIICAHSCTSVSDNSILYVEIYCNVLGFQTLWNIMYVSQHNLAGSTPSEIIRGTQCLW
jgi:hypothetical protein